MIRGRRPNKSGQNFVTLVFALGAKEAKSNEASATLNVLKNEWVWLSLLPAYNNLCWLLAIFYYVASACISCEYLRKETDLNSRVNSQIASWQLPPSANEKGTSSMNMEPELIRKH
jgi:hypothetical protein